MARSQMLASVSQAVTIDLVGIIINHYLMHTVFSEAEELLAQFAPPVNGTLNATNSTISEESGLKTTDGLQWGTLFNIDFFRRIVTIIATNIFWYQWNMWLERILPTRSRSFATSAPTSAAVEKTEGDEEVEEEIIKKWIAQGKVKRASVNWTNTFLKWILHLTLGLALWNSTEIIADALVHFKHPKHTVAKFGGLHWHVLGMWFTTVPLSSLAGFIIIPAYKRNVFDSAVALAFSIFFGAFISQLVPWIFRQEWMQEVLRQQNETMANATSTQLSIGDEL